MDDDESIDIEDEIQGGGTSPVEGLLHFPSVPSGGLKEWTYDMRRSMQEIVPGLFLGPYSSAKPAKPDNLLSNGITHIICVRCTMEAKIVRPKFPDRFRYRRCFYIIDYVCFQFASN